jgi:predicted transcriptional regulator
MTIVISPQLEEHLRHVAQAEGVTVEAYIEQLIRDDEAWSRESADTLDESDPEFAEIQAAVQEGLRQAEQGEDRRAEDVFADLRAKYGIPR